MLPEEFVGSGSLAVQQAIVIFLMRISCKTPLQSHAALQQVPWCQPIKNHFLPQLVLVLEDATKNIRAVDATVKVSHSNNVRFKPPKSRLTGAGSHPSHNLQMTFVLNCMSSVAPPPVDETANVMPPNVSHPD